MNCTVEISMYPLREDYEKQVLDFIDELKNQGLSPKVNAMSTQVKGDFDSVMRAINESIKHVYENEVKASFVMKVLHGDLDLDFTI